MRLSHSYYLSEEQNREYPKFWSRSSVECPQGAQGSLCSGRSAARFLLQIRRMAVFGSQGAVFGGSIRSKMRAMCSIYLVNVRELLTAHTDSMLQHDLQW
jgi:hypothetical protein